MAHPSGEFSPVPRVDTVDTKEVTEIKNEIMDLKPKLENSLDVIDQEIRSSEKPHEGRLKDINTVKTILKDIESGQIKKPEVYGRIVEMIQILDGMQNWHGSTIKNKDEFYPAVAFAVESLCTLWRKTIKEQYEEPKSSGDIINVSWSGQGSGDYGITCDASGIEIVHDAGGYYSTPREITEQICKKYPLSITREQCEDRDAHAPSYYIGGEFLFRCWDDFEDIKKRIKEAMDGWTEKEER